MGQVVRAQAWRGWQSYLNGDFGAFLVDTQAAQATKAFLPVVSFNLGLALLANGKDAEAIAAYRGAGTQFPRSIEELGLRNLHDASKTWLKGERAAPVIELLQLLQAGHVDSSTSPGGRA
jgi:hypothetical protein